MMMIPKHMHMLKPNVHNGSVGNGLIGIIYLFVNVLGFGLSGMMSNEMQSCSIIWKFDGMTLRLDGMTIL